MAQKLAHELCQHLAILQPIAVLREHGRVPDRVVGRKTHEPAVQKIVIQLLHQLPFRANAVETPAAARRVANLRAINITPHVTQNNGVTKTGKSRQSAIDERTTRHDGYGMSQSRRAMIECIFGWGKQHGTMRKTKHRGIGRVATDFMLNLIAYNLIRIPKLLAL